MTFEQWREQLIADIENAAAMCAERDVVEHGNPQNVVDAQVFYGMAEKIRGLAPDDARLADLYKEESALAQVPEREYGEAEHRCHEAREDVLRSISDEHGPYENLDEFFAVLRRKADETITEFSLAS